MSLIYRGKEIFKPLNTGWIDENIACVREYVANIFFYRKNGTTIMIDAGYNYERLEEKMCWLGISPAEISHILITHQDTDHVGAVELDSPGLFRNAKLYISEIENRYLIGEVRRNVMHHMYKLPNELAVKSLAKLEENLRKRKQAPIIITGHTGWSDNLDFAFLHKDKLCSPFCKKVHDPSAPYDAYDESDDTEENAKTKKLLPVGQKNMKR